MTDENTLKASGRVALFIWIKSLLVSGEAKVDKKNPSIIELSSSASACFALGRRKENNTPIISADASISMFLFSYNILEIVFEDENGMYIVFGIDVPVFALKVRISTKRRLMLNVSELKLRNKGSSIDLYSHLTNEAARTSHLSRVLHRVHFRFTTSIYDVMPIMDDGGHSYLGILTSEVDDNFDLTDPEHFTFIDPLNHD